MAVVIKPTARAWVVALVALLVAGAGMSSLMGGATTTSQLRIGLAAGVLSAYAAAAAIFVTRRGDRTWPRCLLWGGTVPILVGVLNAALVLPQAGLATAVVSAIPWWAGAVVISALGPWLPAFRRPEWTRRRASD